MSLVAESSTGNFAPCGPLLGELGAQNLIISMSVQYKLSLKNFIKNPSTTFRLILCTNKPTRWSDYSPTWSRKIWTDDNASNKLQHK